MNKHVAGSVVGKLASCAAVAAGCAGLAAEGRADAGLVIDLRAIGVNG